jgi:hypothetical protein
MHTRAQTALADLFFLRSLVIVLPLASQVMVLDEHATQVVSSIVGMYDITEVGRSFLAGCQHVHNSS